MKDMTTDELVREVIRNAREAALLPGVPRNNQLQIRDDLRTLARGSETHRSAAYRAAREIERARH